MRPGIVSDRACWFRNRTALQPWVVAAVLFSLALFPQASAQLAITEVMSDASEAVLPKRPDFWELTNFGSTRIDLSAYRWSDSAGFEAAEPHFFQGKSIGPGESIILVRSNVVTTLFPQQFYDWWGVGNLPQPLQVLFYRGPGFSQEYDAVQLWKVTALATSLVDRVEFYSAAPGATHTYDPETGLLDSLSRVGQRGAFRAAGGLDVGSPGRTMGPVPLRILQAPASVEVDAGAPVAFSVSALGMPKPRYQWRRNNVPIAGANESQLTIPHAVAASAGLYTVEMNNDVETLLSAPAELRVSTALSCARVIRGPEDLELTPRQDAVFSVLARGFPLPTYQWRFNGAAIPGATNAVFALPFVSPGMSGVVSVEVANFLCSTSAVARLRVVDPPDLRVTEVMAAASTNNALHRHGDWWELTNFESNRVSLQGYRFDDTPGVIAGAVVITNAIWVEPGESILFVSDLSRQDFLNWWGAENLPPGVQIVSFAGNSFDALGDSLYLWNATATSRDDVIVSLSFVNDTRGVSLWFDPVLAEFGELSIEGQRGAFRAVAGDDIGSPGWITAPPPRVLQPRLISIVPEGESVTVTWTSQAGYLYSLEYCDDLSQADWIPLLSLLAEGVSLKATDGDARGGLRFYRVIANLPSP
ncbi:MAG: lamin tail domain-containing protein [Verrucomicrobiales bacterium]|nr:lamin tail domain-containing protein [Verrucomicrobiales bacterium]